jgi:uncharacterized protein (DUF488 family)
MNNVPGPVPPAGRPLLSVGHSNHELACFLDLLRVAGVTAIADVRSSPFSRRLPQYNRGELETALRRHGIAYVYLGDLLGGRPHSRDLYDEEGRTDYEKVRTTVAFQQGLDRLLRGLDQFTVAMLCAEEDPLDCHRGLMITPALGERGVRPGHLRKDGSVETTDAMEQRLLAETRVGAGLLDGLFASLVSAGERRELLAEAYRVMGREKAFQLKEKDEDQEAS